MHTLLKVLKLWFLVSIEYLKSLLVIVHDLERSIKFSPSFLKVSSAFLFLSLFFFLCAGVNFSYHLTLQFLTCFFFFFLNLGSQHVCISNLEYFFSLARICIKYWYVDCAQVSLPVIQEFLDCQSRSILKNILNSLLILNEGSPFLIKSFYFFCSMEFLSRSISNDGPLVAFGGSDGVIRVLSMLNWKVCAVQPSLLLILLPLSQKMKKQ